jgi:hypothetical protein
VASILFLASLASDIWHPVYLLYDADSSTVADFLTDSGDADVNIPAAANPDVNGVPVVQ